MTGSSPASQSLSFNNGNQITTTGYGYDGAGNQTTTPGSSFTYNAAEQRTTATVNGKQTTYTYAGSGNTELLSQSTAGGDTYHYAYGRTDQNGLPVIEELSLTTGGSTYNAYIAHDPTGLPVAIQVSTGTIALYVYDGHNNPISLTTDFNSTAYMYQFDPYGTATVTQNSGGTGLAQNPYTFSGGLQDRATGQIKFGARWYTPTTGTWTQQDPLNAPLDPSVADRYAYASGDPINVFDPTGGFSLNGSVTGCYWICVSVGLAQDSSGNTALTGGLGVGSPGVSASVGAGTGNAGSGWGTSANCSYGPFSVSYDSSGNVSGSVGTSYSTGSCDATVNGSLQLN